MTHWDETEFASIFDAIHPGLLRYLECTLGHSGAAQDIAQETFVRLYRLGPGRIRPGEERFWLYRVASNLARNETRRARTFERIASLFRIAASPRAANPLVEAEIASDRQRLLAALGTLPESQRAAFLLREQEELQYSEIADVLGVSLAKVKVDIYRARIALRAMLHPPEGRAAERQGANRHGL